MRDGTGDRRATSEYLAVLAGETDIEGFRRHSRACLTQGIGPERVRWQVATRMERDLFAQACVDSPDTPSAGQSPSARVINVPGFFLPLLDQAVLHAQEDRFSLLYRLLWRLVKDANLRHDPLDADRQQAERMARAVAREMHKMTAFVRFRPLAAIDGQSVEHVAWFEPEHHIVEAAAPFFARRFAQMRWSILTPLCCVRWDGEALAFGLGAAREDAPPADAAEQLWLTYYASIFNPARLKLAALRKEMPQRYWKNLPEATLIQPLASAAPRRCAEMRERAPVDAAKRRPAVSLTLALREPSPVGPSAPATLGELSEAIQRCRACPLAERATQAVPGEGPERARLMVVGEQPGDREDLAGRPFVGPSGQLLDRALKLLGWPRSELFLTNAVRHFKFELRGKRRIHKTPAQQEADACLQWLEAEIGLVKPAAAIALGATAARALLGQPVSVTRERGRWLRRADGLPVLVTLHPSALLRMDGDLESAFEEWLADLRHAASVVSSPDGRLR